MHDKTCGVFSVPDISPPNRLTVQTSSHGTVYWLTTGSCENPESQQGPFILVFVVEARGLQQTRAATCSAGTHAGGPVPTSPVPGSAPAARSISVRTPVKRETVAATRPRCRLALLVRSAFLGPVTFLFGDESANSCELGQVTSGGALACSRGGAEEREAMGTAGKSSHRHWQQYTESRDPGLGPHSCSFRPERAYIVPA